LEKSIRERTDDGARPPAEADRRAGYLGLTADDANDRGRGVRVLAVRAGGPAAAAGLKANDLITAIGGVRVREMSDMAEILALFSAGDTVAMDIQRDGKQQQVKVALGQSPTAKEAAKPAVAATEPRVAKKPADEPPMVLPKEPPDVKPELAPPRPKPLLPAAPPPTVEQLQRRIEQLERRVEQLEKALAEALKKP
jgi:membrane-associated protease RseP (regulator of RpoE activity)